MEYLIKSPTLFFLSSILIGILLRWNVGFGPYSGMNKPPLYGDYEAQRHWQEITVNTPPTEWYKNTSDNDLLYWGLDYPPLTAYHSWVCGRIAQYINPNWTALHSSRGTEGYKHKLFMRYSVLVADIFIFFPALYFLFRNDSSKAGKHETLIKILLYPGLILIDYGHFQYNNISLGLFIMAVCFLQKHRDILGAIAFTLSLNYKQMELYHSIPFFCYLLGSSLKKGIFQGSIRVLQIGVAVIATFVICWWPFLSTWDDIFTVATRLFPVGRGLYEDKVANFWCSISPILKLKQILPSSRLIQLCIATTLLASLPSSMHLLFSPSIRSLKYACVNVSLAFFLFSFQVHEKSILIPAISICLLHAEESFLVTWFLHTSTFSMAPLLRQDGLWLQYFSIKYIFLIVSHLLYKSANEPSSGIKGMRKYLSFRCLSTSTVAKVLRFECYGSIIILEILTFLLFVMKPPSQLPDLFPVLISTFSCFVFLYIFLFCNYLQIFCQPLISNTKKTK